MTTPTTFPPFPKLPTEIRLQIWRIAMPRRVLFEREGPRKSSFRRINYSSINACRESREEALRYIKTSGKGRDEVVFDADGDILCLCYSDVRMISNWPRSNISGSGKQHGPYEELFRVDLTQVLKRIQILGDVQVPCGEGFKYNDFSQVLVPILRRFPAIREINVGRLRSDRLSVKTGTRGLVGGIERFAIMRKPTVRKVRARVEEAMAKEELLRPKWKAPFISFAQLSDEHGSHEVFANMTNSEILTVKICSTLNFTKSDPYKQRRGAWFIFCRPNFVTMERVPIESLRSPASSDEPKRISPYTTPLLLLPKLKKERREFLELKSSVNLKTETNEGNEILSMNQNPDPERLSRLHHGIYTGVRKYPVEPSKLEDRVVQVKLKTRFKAVRNKEAIAAAHILTQMSSDTRTTEELEVAETLLQLQSKPRVAKLHPPLQVNGDQTLDSDATISDDATISERGTPEPAPKRPRPNFRPAELEQPTKKKRGGRPKGSKTKPKTTITANNNDNKTLIAETEDVEVQCTIPKQFGASANRVLWSDRHVFEHTAASPEEPKVNLQPPLSSRARITTDSTSESARTEADRRRWEDAFCR
ncbi:uncharacterized protein LY89DRAFT_720146 [Mollisia scopiformis]|uniref:2EXR domain-containing protein n=1 Tax=Mollisia scopiformis TaxID=149040 RepID=A0A194X4A4_MOLSC|nr:uncharacterized protein LY89DRAFT_720146 [Mollisia scopiformis]KUJ14657.1 hypothetical protein LY89DRAFT_720146 [Mollisia scopiformis]